MSKKRQFAKNKMAFYRASWRYNFMEESKRLGIVAMACGASGFELSGRFTLSHRITEHWAHIISHLIPQAQVPRTLFQ